MIKTYIAVIMSHTDMTLTEDDIPSASLSEPLDKHTVSALRWWLLCRGINSPTSLKKQLIGK